METLSPNGGRTCEMRLGRRFSLQGGAPQIAFHRGGGGTEGARKDEILTASSGDAWMREGHQEVRGPEEHGAARRRLRR